MSPELRDFRTAWDPEPERLNFKGKKQSRIVLRRQRFRKTASST